jgi:hypothetical protein
VVVQINLDTAEGHAVLAELTRDKGTPGSPLRVFVEYVHGGASVAEVVAQCRQLVQGR